MHSAHLYIIHHTYTRVGYQGHHDLPTCGSHRCGGPKLPQMSHNKSQLYHYPQRRILISPKSISVFRLEYCATWPESSLRHSELWLRTPEQGTETYLKYYSPQKHTSYPSLGLAQKKYPSIRKLAIQAT
jgi:hypothetical protein